MRDDLALMLIFAFDRALDCAAVEQEVEQELNSYHSLVIWSRGRAQLVTRTEEEE